MKPIDVHFCSRPALVVIRLLDLSLMLSFERNIIDGAVTLHVERIDGDELILDTRGLTIHSVENAAGFELGTADPIFGAPLKIRLKGADPLRVHYSTSPGASGLQWLEPAQSAGEGDPFL